MRLPSLNGRTLALVGVLGTLLALFIYVALRSGPLASVPVTVAAAENLAMLSGNINDLRTTAPGVFAIYRRGVAR